MAETICTPSLDWLKDPTVFNVNRIKAHSDHKCYVDGKMLKQSLNGTWKFTFSRNPQTREKEFYKTGYNIDALNDIKVPGHMSLQGYGQVQYTNTMYPWDGVVEGDAPTISDTQNDVGGYVIDVNIDDILKGKRLYISFQGVQSAFYLYVNDKFVGYSEDSFTPAEFEITDFVVDGKNRIGVEVYQRSTGDWLEDQDYWRLYGIFREVYLYAIPETHVYDLFIHTNVEENYKDASLMIDAEVIGDKENVSVDMFLTDMQGNKVIDKKQMTFTEAFGASHPVEDAILWSAENPYLYELTIVLNRNGKEVETIKNKVGIRRFEIKNKVMLINGKRIEIFGVNRHEFSHTGGRVVSEEEMIWDLNFMKQHNINAVRTCHYPDATRWYELCDEYGIYLIDEANLETHGTWTLEGRDGRETAIPGSRPEWRDIVVDRAMSVLGRDKNHPSVIILSCGNESHQGKDINEMSKYYKSADPSRIVHYEGVWADKENYYDTTDMETRMYAKPWHIEEYLKNDPPKPFLSCEYSHAMGNSNGNIKDYTDLLDKYEMFQGGFIWDYIDQSLEKDDGYGGKMLAYGGDFGDRPNDNNFCVNGLIYGNRKTTPKMQEIKFCYQMFNIFPDINGVKIKNRNLFSGTDRYVLKTWVLVDGVRFDEQTLDIDVPALTTKYIEVSRKPVDMSGDVIVQASMVLKYDEKWAKAGFEQAFGETVVQSQFDVKKTEEPKRNTLRVEHGNAGTGVYGDGFGYLFSKNYNGLISIKKNGVELLEKKPMPCFYRASTDNDRGCGYMFDSGLWLYAEKWQRRISFSVEEKDDCVQVHYEYELPICEDAKTIVKGKEYAPEKSNFRNDRKGVIIKVTYSVFEDGKCKVRCVYPGVKGLPELPAFGMQFVFNKNFEKYRYYGKGPMENYRDRNNGARYGVFSDNATDNMAEYIIPQGCGNRTEVRNLSITDGKNYVGFEACNAPFECSVLHFNDAQIEEAYHLNELPRPMLTFVKIMAAQMGVGGDDSWGAHVHAPYRLYADQPIDFEFAIVL